MPGQMDQGAAPAQGAAEGQAEGQPPSIDRMVVSLDQGLTQVTQLIGQVDPETGDQLAQINEQYRQVMQDFVAKQQGGGQAPAETVDAQAGQGGVPAF